MELKQLGDLFQKAPGVWPQPTVVGERMIHKQELIHILRVTKIAHFNTAVLQCMYSAIYVYCSAESLNKGHFRTASFVLCKEVILFGRLI
jgi:hypothetical protein